MDKQYYRQQTMPEFFPGDLLFVSVNEKGTTLVLRENDTDIKEAYHLHPQDIVRHRKYEKSLGYCACLVESVSRNDLGQATAYRLMINGEYYTCKALLAERYLFRL